ncbi:hypothetical protein HMPREF1129_2543 [Actinomyces naeslundii str. Howell 279]|uniref:Uncharacterized protein n=1 Tax=Actinomyces naeslundii (strain ATCC 12104 / DSM 43013 / CCUG 2238 / JCM 8349 / NCTC 10301 / Howell 279) TaxID=1115803 RepID=J3JKH3_ACTNH|nr:hypothetical protein HMPREF1129_2543 [Actinomyces naeslundii str. Howell 279]
MAKNRCLPHDGCPFCGVRPSRDGQLLLAGQQPHADALVHPCRADVDHAVLVRVGDDAVKAQTQQVLESAHGLRAARLLRVGSPRTWTSRSL